MLFYGDGGANDCRLEKIASNICKIIFIKYENAEEKNETFWRNW